jgi:hypothetical protein
MASLLVRWTLRLAPLPALLLAANARAEPFIRHPVRLEYERGPGAEGCPAEAAVRHAIVTSAIDTKEDPFSPTAKLLDRKLPLLGLAHPVKSSLLFLRIIRGHRSVPSNFSGGSWRSAGTCAMSPPACRRRDRALLQGVVSSRERPRVCDAPLAEARRRGAERREPASELYYFLNR